jgi:flagellin
MIINHNVSAMNANRHFAMNVKKMDENLESLSSGLRINKGADDAAGLAVSEKMRAQIRGLHQASRNIQDGASLVQTAEGFLKESNDVLQRIRELTVQSANGTYTNEDRAQITVEIDEMVKELNRIHEDAKFNTLRLLDGKTLGFNSFGYPGVDEAGADRNTTALGLTDISLARNVNFNNIAEQHGNNGVVVQAGANTDERLFIQMDVFNTYALGITDRPVTDDGAGQLTYQNAAQAVGNESTNQNLAWREFSFYQPDPINLDAALYLESEITPPAKDTNGDGPVTIEYLPPLEGNRLNVTTSEDATASISVVDVALNKVNKQRADLGAFQNRLDMAMRGVDNAAENLQAAESRIRDADMAKEFVKFTKNQILAQSSASMTAQANVRSQLIMRVIG